MMMMMMMMMMMTAMICGPTNKHFLHEAQFLACLNQISSPFFYIPLFPVLVMHILVRIVKRRAENFRSGGGSCCDTVAYEAVQSVRSVQPSQTNIPPPSSRCILS